MSDDELDDELDIGLDDASDKAEGADDSDVTDLHERMKRSAQAGKQAAFKKAMARQPKIALLRYAGFALLVVLSLSMVLYALGTSSGHEQKLSENSARINELNRALEAGQGEEKSLPKADEIEPGLSAAAGKAAELSSLQNDMAKLSLDTADDGQLTEYGKLVESARPYFTPGTLSGGSLLPQGQWYQPYQKGKDAKGEPAWLRMPADKWRWEPVPVKDVDRSGNPAAIWRAVLVGGEKDGKMLAWVTGRFDPSRGQFFDMRVGQTPEGRARNGATNSPAGAGTDENEPPAARSNRDLANDAGAALDRSRRKEGSTGTTTTTTTKPTQTTGPAPTTGPGMADPGLEPTNGGR